jgi:inorganic triphosphatase YgiF
MSAAILPGEGTEEREIKLAVPDGFVLPALSGVDGISVVDHGDHLLRAVYWDTDGLGLAHAGVGLRRRDGVWAYKGRARREGDAVVREEIEAPGEELVLPAAVRRSVERWVDVDALQPVARLDTLRHRIDVVSGAAAVELVHDRVTVRDGSREVTRFAEVEVEFLLSSAPLADRLAVLLIAHGAVVDTTPKYLRALRALGHNPAQVPP